MILEYKNDNSKNADFTRTSGGDPDGNDSPETDNRFYPHERGWSFQVRELFKSFLILPARAGVILFSYLLPRFFLNFTRTSGGDPSDNNESDTEIMFYLYI